MQSGSAVTTMRLGDYFQLIRRHWVAVLVCVALGGGLAVAYIGLAPRQYRAQTAVLVTDTTPNNATPAERASGFNLDTEAQLVTSTDTVADAAQRLHLSRDATAQLADNVAVSVPPNTEILSISYTAGSAADAQRGSLAFAEAYLAQRQASAEAVLASDDKVLQSRIDAVNAQLATVTKAATALKAGTPEKSRLNSQATALNNQLATLGAKQNAVRAEIVSPGRIVTQPSLPTSPSSPNRLAALAAGILLGLVAGAALAAYRHRVHDVLRTPEDVVRRTGLPVAAVLNGELHADELTVLEPSSVDGRGYARLRNLVAAQLDESARRAITVAGVRRGAGPVAANLAASLGRAGEPVVLVCADVFGTTAAALLEGPPGDGLAEVLAEEQPVEGALRTLPGIPALRVLGAGRDVDRADALLQIRGPRTLVDRLLESARFVIVEAPPTTDGQDAQAMANGAAMAILVIEAGSTRAREVSDARTQFEAMGTPVLGAVIVRYGRDSTPDRPSSPAEAGDDAPGQDAEQADGDRAVTDPADDAAREDAAPEPVTSADSIDPQARPGTGQEAAATPATVAAAHQATGNGRNGAGGDASEQFGPALAPPGARGPAPR